VLLFWLRAGGGVQITGTTEDLCDLIGWIAAAIKTGNANAMYAADGGVACVDIVRERPEA
jgi:drug/metabolite transporter superfamily protein YnfA